MKKGEIINTLQRDKQFLNDNFGVVTIALFRFDTKGHQKPASDVEFKEPSYRLKMI